MPITENSFFSQIEGAEGSSPHYRETKSPQYPLETVICHQDGEFLKPTVF